MRLLLDNARTQADGLAAIERVAASAEGDAVRVEALKRYGDLWLQATFANETRQARERIAAALHAGIDAAEAPSLTPLQRQGRAILAEVEHSVGRLVANTRSARNEIEGDRALAPALAGWGDRPHVLFRDQRGWYDQDAVIADFGPIAHGWADHARKAYPRLAGVPTDHEKRIAWMRARGFNVSDDE